ncbi:MAG: membrane protein insertion efficiency factor YidD [Oscillospiraceae bacterium]|nr:membrane protein insertion efficiency factor YidD [Oscillospiraceae bacterium]
MKKILIGLIRLYKKQISPSLPPSCRYVPSCSEYAIAAIQERGAFKGTFLALWRILRCNPFSKGGLDQVPHLRKKNHKRT